MGFSRVSIIKSISSLFNEPSGIDNLIFSKWKKTKFFLPRIRIDEYGTIKRSTKINLKNLKEIPCVYMIEFSGVITYIGTTENLRNRIIEHRIYSWIDRIWYLEIHGRDKRLEVEKRMIKIMYPMNNNQHNNEPYYQNGFTDLYKYRKSVIENRLNAIRLLDLERIKI